MRTHLFLAFVCCNFLLPAQDKKYTDKKQRKAFYQQLSARYNSGGVKEIWGTDTENNFDAYVDGPAETQLIEDYSTVIHELLHSYNSTENNGNYYFVEPGVRIYVPLTKTYKSKELNSYVRKGVQDSVFRYGIYVGARSTLPGHNKKLKGINDTESNEASSIQQGIYGLLEEFNAYYYGAEAAYELYDYFLEKYGEVNSSPWKDYKHAVMSEALAYYEFNLFFGWYMVYAKQKHPDVYEGISSNKAFRVVYTLLQDKFANLLNMAEKRLNTVKEKNKPDVMDVMDFSGSDEDIFRFLEAAGMPAEQIYEEKTTTVNGKTVTVKKTILDDEVFESLKAQYMDVVKQLNAQNDMTVFFAQTSRQIVYMSKLMTPQMKEEINKLMLPGVTAKNYAGYMK